MPRTKTSRACAFLIFALAGCSANPAVPIAPASPANAAQNDGAARARAEFAIRIPRQRRHAHYVSPNTQSLTVAIGSEKPVVRNLTARSPGCTTSGGATQCRFTIGIPSGTDTFHVATYDAVNAGGRVLSRGSETKIVKRGALAVIPITLQGIVASVSVALGNSAPNAGTATTTPVYVTAFDPSGAMIVGPADYNVPIALTDSDASGITSVTTTPIAGPGGSGTLSYDGRSLENVSIGATAGSATVTPATFAPLPTVIASFNIPAAFGVSTASLAISAGADGNVWYTVYGTNSGIVRVTPGGSSASYIAGVTSNLMGGGVYPGIALGPDGNMWFTDSFNKMVGVITPAGTVTEYSAPGAICPNRIVAGPPGDGGLWFTSTCSASIGHITTGGTAVEYALSGAGTTMEAILVGQDKNLYLDDQTNESIAQVKVASGAVTSNSEFVLGPNPIDGTFDNKLYGLAQTADGQLWFSNQGCIPSTIGNVQINATNFSSSTVHQFITTHGCSLPTFMTPTPDGKSFFMALWSYPVFEGVTPTGIGTAPAQSIYAINVLTPNGVPQNLWDVAIGPNGNVWATNNVQSAVAPANILELAY